MPLAFLLEGSIWRAILARPGWKDEGFAPE